jgi:hypothetical protein
MIAWDAVAQLMAKYRDDLSVESATLGMNYTDGSASFKLVYYRLAEPFAVDVEVHALMAKLELASWSESAGNETGRDRHEVSFVFFPTQVLPEQPA